VSTDALGQALYEASDLKHAPPWQQLGDVTRSVWIERAGGDLHAACANGCQASRDHCAPEHRCPEGACHYTRMGFQ
jgi:hypothetical protein